MTNAIRIDAVGPPDVLKCQSTDVPDPGPNEVRLRQTAAGVNFIDIYQRSGLYPLAELPSGIGSEAAGVVEAVGSDVQDFRPGDTVRVSTTDREGDRQLTQVFEGVVIRRRGGGAGASFTVRRVAREIGVERTFMLHSPVVEAVETVRRGAVRRSRLYYLRGLSGRAARIKEARRN